MREKLKMGTVYTMSFCIDGASDKAIENLEKEMEEFAEDNTDFELFEIVIDKIGGDREARLRSVNNK